MFKKILFILLSFHCTQNSVLNASDNYILDTGDAGSDALNRQQSFFGKDSQALLKKAGLKRKLIVWDIGCGNGCMTEYIAKKVGPEGHVFAFDISPEMLEKAKNRLTNLGLHNVTYILGDIKNVPLPEQSPDLIYSRFIFMHLPDPKAVMKRLVESLKPNGTFTLQESALKYVGSSHTLDGLESYRDALINLCKAKKVDFNLGETLQMICESVGLEITNHNSKLYKISALEASGLMKIRVQSVINQVLELANQEEIEKWKTLPDRISEFQENPDFYFISGKLTSLVSLKKQ